MPVKLNPVERPRPLPWRLPRTGLEILVLLLCLAAGWCLLPAARSPELGLVRESWVVVSDGAHNAFPDLVEWRGALYLVYRSAASHLDMRSKLVLQRSTDARNWEKTAELALAAEDIRDPKLAVIGERLFIYALKNVSPVALPYATIYTSSADGSTWLPWQLAGPPGWLFWRPKTRDGQTWYVPGYSVQHDQTALFQSRDGISWEQVSQIYAGAAQSEVELAFTASGGLAAVIRLERADGGAAGMFAASQIAWAQPPFLTWSSQRSRTTRLDGPALFAYQGELFAAGRAEPAGGVLPGSPGGLLNKKRTALFGLSAAGLKHLTDLPSSGDTAYPAAVVRGDEALVVYYTNDPRQDLPWLVGQFQPTQLRIASIDLPALVRAANAP